mmetsp:Transcript_98186/g.305296  ORF Transcript_98186/g.305296 Transcript_98186/m.305296 type:complete len:204 (-) Transcript_98186:666-1277(-)
MPTCATRASIRPAPHPMASQWRRRCLDVVASCSDVVEVSGAALAAGDSRATAVEAPTEAVGRCGLARRAEGAAWAADPVQACGAGPSPSGCCWLQRRAASSLSSSASRHAAAASSREARPLSRAPRLAAWASFTDPRDSSQRLRGLPACSTPGRGPPGSARVPRSAVPWVCAALSTAACAWTPRSTHLVGASGRNLSAWAASA